MKRQSKLSEFFKMDNLVDSDDELEDCDPGIVEG